MKPRLSADEIVRALDNDPSLVGDINQNPKAGLEKLFDRVYKPYEDKAIYRIVVVVMSLTLLAVVGTSIVISAVGSESEIPSEIIAIAATALGALAGLLAPSPITRD
jgi:hypothetical protein